jgi:formate hydrogenlyase subunit 3/multisubunit Na+/H+ antiporter MnhD subunit
MDPTDMVALFPWPVWIIFLPLLTGIFAFLFRGRGAQLGMVTAVGLLPALMGLTWQVLSSGPQQYSVGGWGVPLGIDLYADGLSIIMLVMTALVGIGTTFYATGYYSPTGEVKEKNHHQDPALFWSLWLLLWAALNCLFLSADVFNLYVALEFLGLSAVALVAMAGGPSAVAAAMRYLLVSLLGSLSYLLGVALLYFAHGTLSLGLLAESVTSSPVSFAATTLMTAGLVMKTALFPLHFWLPPAHANAPAPVSAVLSALVVKASFYLLLRLWFQVFTNTVTPSVALLLGILGVAAIFWGSVQALMAQRLKLLVAYSTVAQLGYIFLVFPLAQAKGTGFSAWCGGLYFILSHACAKAAAFLAAGTVLYGFGHDRIDELAGITQRLPVSMFAFGVAGVSLIGLPPSGGFIGKWLLLNAALAGGQWWWAIVIITGGLLAAAYVFRFFSRAFSYVEQVPMCRDVPWSMELTALALGLSAMALGIIATQPLAVMQIGAPLAGPVLTGGLP